MVPRTETIRYRWTRKRNKWTAMAEALLLFSCSVKHVIRQRIPALHRQLRIRNEAGGAREERAARGTSRAMAETGLAARHPAGATGDSATGTLGGSRASGPTWHNRQQ